MQIEWKGGYRLERFALLGIRHQELEEKTKEIGFYPGRWEIDFLEVEKFRSFWSLEDYLEWGFAVCLYPQSYETDCRYAQTLPLKFCDSGWKSTQLAI